LAIDLTYLKRFEGLETELIQKYGIPKGPIVAIGGLSGTGKDTAANNLQKLFEEKEKIKGIPVNIAGEIIRAAAEKAGYKKDQMEMFSQYLTEHGEGKLDFYAEKRTIELAISNGRGIYVGRIAPLALYHLQTKMGNVVTIWMETDLRVIAERLQKDPNRKDYYEKPIEEIMQKVTARDEKDTRRFKDPKVYGLDPAEKKGMYDLVLNNSHYTKEQTANKLHDFVISRLKAFK